ncbi:TolC family protein [Arcobacter sp. KX21116]|uniref:TolC family protein n=1 Tax=Arcobacter iocasae TaxID=2906515 RepID=UPI0035D4379D
MMQFLRFKLSLATIVLVASSSFAAQSDKLDESILLKKRLEIFDLSKEQIEENSSKLKKDWINPVNYTYSKVYGDKYDTEKSLISVDQPIFKTGGIYKAIKYANAQRLYSHLDLDLQKKAMIKDTTTILFNIHKLQLQIKKQELLVKNGEIDIQRKKEQVFNGFADTSLLDNAILDTNTSRNALADLVYQKEELINEFATYASGDYESFTLPKFSILDKENFLKDNLTLKRAKADISSKKDFSWMTISKYLPTVSATFDYTKYHSSNNPTINTDDDVQNYGIKITMPLDTRTFNDIQSTRIDYLKAKLDFDNQILEQENYFKSKLSKIKMIDSKIAIAKNDYVLYNSLLDVVVEEKEAELKTQSDVDTLLNSKKIRELDLKIYNIDKQIELLDIYSKIS